MSEFNGEYPQYKNTPSAEYFKSKTKKKSNLFRPEMPKKEGAENQYILRILLDRHNEHEDPFTEMFMHWNVGKQMGFVCPKYTRNEPCAICEHVKAIYQKANDIAEENGIDLKDKKKMKENSKILALWRIAGRINIQKAYYCPVLIRGSEEEGVKWWRLTETLHSELESEIRDEENVLDPYRGYDLALTVKNGGKTTDDGKSIPSYKLKFKLTDKKAILPGKSAEEINALLDSVPEAFQNVRVVSSDETRQFLNELVGNDNSQNVYEEKEGIHTEFKKPSAESNTTVVQEEQSSFAKVQSLIGDLIPDDI